MTRSDWESIRDELGESGTAYRTLLVLAFDAALVALAWWCNRRGSGPWFCLAVALQTLAMLHGSMVHHEAVHRAVFQNDRYNVWLGHALGWIVALPFLPRRHSHALHHTWTGHPDGDPANRRAIARFGHLDEREVRWIEGLWRTWIPFLVINDRIGLWIGPFRARREDPQSARLRAEVWSIVACLSGYAVAVVVLAATATLGVALRLYLPALVLTLCVEEMVNLPHHAETPLIDGERPLPLWEQDRVTHECQDVPVWSSLVLLHFNAHIAHHYFPWLPWYRLPEARRLLSRRAPDRVEPLANELRWSLERRRRRFLDVMGHYFILEARKRGQISGRAR